MFYLVFFSNLHAAKFLQVSLEERPMQIRQSTDNRKGQIFKNRTI